MFNEKKNRKIFLLNDTENWYHFGCAGTSMGLKNKLTNLGFEVNPISLPALQKIFLIPESLEDFVSNGFYEKWRSDEYIKTSVIRGIEDSHIVLINGEGSIHGANFYPRLLLYIAHISKTRFGKEVQIINHSCFPNDFDLKSETNYDIYGLVYKELDFVAAREILSYNIIRGFNTDVVQAFDCLPLFIKRSYKGTESGGGDYVVLSGGIATFRDLPEIYHEISSYLDSEFGCRCIFLSGAKSFPSEDDRQLIDRLTQLDNSQIGLKEAGTIQEWLEIIARSKLLISGRFHHTIASIMLGTPYIAFESNTPKVAAMCMTCNMPGPVLITDRVCNDVIDEIKRQIAERFAAPADFIATRDCKERIIDMAGKNFSGLCQV